MRLKDKVAIVTGAKSGIGLATARRFSKEGAKLVMADVEDAQQELESIVKSGCEAVFVRTDVSSEGDVHELIRQSVGRYGRIDVLVNNAGIELARTVTDTTEEQWDRLIAVNLKGVFLCSKAVVVEMRRTGGEPAGQTVLDRWASTRYLWHQMLAQHGYLVMSFDNRGTPAPRGRAWRKVVYRQIGVLAAQEQAAAARVVQSWPFVDSKRIAVWGWSGGGSMTLNQMFRYPDIYQVGMSVAPVTDQHFYDTIYQERYMGLPQDNEADYRRGSPVTHAAGLTGKLLIVHGSGDDNVHYKGTEVLANVLIAAKKQFTMMEYPNRRHDISQGRGTTRHLYELLTRFLEDNMSPGPAR